VVPLWSSADEVERRYNQSAIVIIGT
jgi:hypothetical protein